MKTTYPIWILIADSSRARLYSVDTAHRPMMLCESFEHQESRAMEHDLVTDRPGRMPQSHGGAHPGHGSRSGMEPGTTAKEHEHEIFARTLADALKVHLSHHDYCRLILVANPEFLGILREALSEQVKKHVSASVNRNYTSLDAQELEQHLAPLLAA
jgi:protein required for attachment to host cells